MELYQLIAPLGIATYTMIFLTALLGIFRKKLPYKFWFTWHAALGIAALMLGAVHGALVIFF